MADAERLAKAQESLARATSGQSTMNYAPIYEGFAAKGIPMSEIHPRENVFTFAAWRALGRTVKKGEHGVRVVTFAQIASEKTDPETGEVKVTGRRRAWGSTVFHISQTEATSQKPEAESRKPEDGSQNPTPALASFPVQEYRPTMAPAPAPRPEPAPAPVPEQKPTPAAPAPAPQPAGFDWRSARLRRTGVAA